MVSANLQLQLNWIVVSRRSLWFGDKDFGMAFSGSVNDGA